MDLPKRKRNRLVHYDYSRAGAYFVTICTEERRKILCDILGDGKPVPKDPGIIAEEIIRKIPEKYASVCVDHYVVMPNHIHMLLRITEHSGTGIPSRLARESSGDRKMRNLFSFASALRKSLRLRDKYFSLKAP